MDLSKLSTQDLEALRDGDLSKVSTDGLKYLSQAEEPAATAQKAESPSIGSELKRQVGLTVRHGMEGIGQVLDLGGAPIAATLNKYFPAQQNVTGLVTGQAPNPRFDAPSTSMNKLANMMGLPVPENANERIAAEASKLMAGTAGGVGIARAVSSAPGTAGAVAKQLSAQPVNQLAASAGAGVAGQTAKEAGQNPFWQFGAAALGSVAGGLAPDMARSAGNRLSALLPSTRQEVDFRLQSILSDSGVDFSKLPNPVKQSIRAEVTKALNVGGDLNPDAVRRLADIKMVGGTPTKGMLSLDPVQLTREKNLSKIAANMQDDSLKGLPLVENENNASLVRTLNRAAGGDADLYSAGERAIGAINSRDAAAKATESALYQRARDSAGRNIQLSRSDFTNKAFENLAKSNKGAFLPPEVESLLNDISVGQVTKGGRTFNVPFDVDAIDTLKTILAQQSRSTSNGNAKAAIKAVRDALEETPIQPIKSQFGGGQAVTQQGASVLNAADELPENALKAFDKARQFARARRSWQESSAGVNAAIDGVEPDKFIERFVLKGAVSDAEGIVKELRRSPEALDVTKQAVVNYLKKQSLGGASDEVGKFSQSAYNKALASIGDRKLTLLFTPEEVNMLKATGRAASYMQVQPTGSAINNSNSGALVLGKAGDAVEGAIKVVPFGEPLSELLRGARLSMSTRNVRDVPNSLLMQKPQNPLVPRGLLPATVYGGGLLAVTPGLNRPEDR